MRGKQPREGDAIIGQQYLRRAIEVIRHGKNIGTDRIAMLIQIAAGGDQRCLQRVAHAVTEPGLNAKVEEQCREARDQQRRHCGHHAKQKNKPHMQPRSRCTAPAFQPHASQTGRERGDQQQQKRDIGQDHPGQLARARGADRSAAGKCRKSREPNAEREQSKCDGENPARDDIPEPTEKTRRARRLMPLGRQWRGQALGGHGQVMRRCRIIMRRAPREVPIPAASSAAYSDLARA